MSAIQNTRNSSVDPHYISGDSWCLFRRETRPSLRPSEKTIETGNGKTYPKEDMGGVRDWRRNPTVNTKEGARKR